MAAPRKEIIDALVERLSSIGQFQTVGTKMQSWDDVPNSMQPAVFVVPSDEMPEYQAKGYPTIWHLAYKLYIYSRNDGDPSESGHVTQHELISSIEDALKATAEEKSQPNCQNHTTLNGLCDFARIDGNIIKDEGALGDQAFALVQIEVVTQG